MSCGLATPGIVQTNLCVDWTQAGRKRDIGFEVVSRDVAVLRVIIIEKADIGGEARYDFPLVTYIGVEFSVEVIENDAVGRAKINAGTPNAGLKTAFVAEADRTLNDGFFASMRNAAEAVIGQECSAAGGGDAAVVIMCGGGRCGREIGRAHV